MSGRGARSVRRGVSLCGGYLPGGQRCASGGVDWLVLHVPAGATVGLKNDELAHASVAAAADAGAADGGGVRPSSSGGQMCARLRAPAASVKNSDTTRGHAVDERGPDANSASQIAFQNRAGVGAACPTWVCPIVMARCPAVIGRGRVRFRGLKSGGVVVENGRPRGGPCAVSGGSSVAST